jgi:predicted DCC family thiol-disulfide oxidoreductase YuxK
MIQNPVILFDGVCNLCNGTVDFLLKRDKKKRFRFVSLQSEAGELIKQHFGLPEIPDSVALISNGNIYVESEAALEIARMLPFPWNFAGIFRIVPLRWRNSIYRWIARNRYRWFGRKSTCRIPAPEERRYFPEANELKL